jgi:asparagine synthetase B (glutamine-hydrolysing)
MQVVARQKQQAEAFRELFREAILPLMFSGGVDSMTNLAAILSLGYKPPHCYTFRLGERDSTDVQVARHACTHFNISHTIVSIPQTEEVLLADICRVLRIIDKAKKTHVQCSQPFLYLAEVAKQDGYTEALIGMAADDLWGTARAIAAYIKIRGEEWCRDMRRYYISYVGGSDDSCAKTSLACGVQLHDPWRNPAIVDFLLACNWNDMHVPKPKALALRAFPEFWKCGVWYRRNSSLQVNSGVREWHDTLLQSKHNPTHAKAIIVIYRHMLAELHEQSIAV